MPMPMERIGNMFFFIFFDMVHRAPCPMLIGTQHGKVEQNMMK